MKAEVTKLRLPRCHKNEITWPTLERKDEDRCAIEESFELISG